MDARRYRGGHHPRKRMIQYAAAYVFDHGPFRVLDRPLKPGDDGCGMDGAS